MGQSQKPDVLIVGAGPVGLALACELRLRGIDCRLVEKAQKPAPFSKANTISPATMEVFDKLGVAEAVLGNGMRMLSNRAVKGGRVVLEFEIPPLEETRFCFNVNIPQYMVERILTERLKSLGGTVERGVEALWHEQGADGVAACLVHHCEGGSEERVNAKYLVACDGAHSVVRKDLGVPFSGDLYEDKLLVADVFIDWAKDPKAFRLFEHPREGALIFMHDDGVVLAWPYHQQDLWHIIVPMTEQEDQALDEPGLDDLSNLIRHRTGMALPLRDPMWISKFRIHRRCVERYLDGRVLLAGDAAHIHSPYGGMGLNTGIQDAHNLAWKLDLALAGMADDSLLHSYGEERRPIAMEVLERADKFQTTLISKNPVKVLFRNLVLPRLVKNPKIMAKIFRGATQLSVSYARSSLSRTYEGSELARDKRWEQALKAGDRAQDVVCWTLEGERTGLDQELNVLKFSLLAISTGKSGSLDELVEAAKRARARLGDRCRSIIVLDSEQRAAALPSGVFDKVLIDRSGALATLYGARENTIHMIRPDQYIGARFQPATANDLDAYLDHILAAKAARAVAGARPDWVSNELYPFASRFVEIDGNSIHYVDEGEGPPILFMHGNPTWSFDFREIIQALASTHRCIAMDMAGFGLSKARPDFRSTPLDHALLAKKFIETLDLRDITMAVHDWGGPVGFFAAGQMPERFRAFIIGDTRAWSDVPKFEKRFSKVMQTKFGRWLVESKNFVAAKAVPKGHALRKLSDQELAHFVNPYPTPESRRPHRLFAVALTQADDFLKQVERAIGRLQHLPALIVWAEHDHGFPLDEARRFEKLFPNSHVVVLKGAAHFMFDDAPEVVTKAIRDWWPTSQAVLERKAQIALSQQGSSARKAAA